MKFTKEETKVHPMMTFAFRQKNRLLLQWISVTNRWLDKVYGCFSQDVSGMYLKVKKYGPTVQQLKIGNQLHNKLVAIQTKEAYGSLTFF